MSVKTSMGKEDVMRNRMSPEVDQELSYVLLTELMAYQIATPVRWIETQDTIFTDLATERLIEIGPTDTLRNMSRRTVAYKYEERDQALSLTRGLLHIEKDQEHVLYNYTIPNPQQLENELDDKVPSNEEPEAGMAFSEATSTITSAQNQSKQLATVSVQEVADEPVSCLRSLHFIVATGLKKRTIDVPRRESIKNLSQGRSTVQNEIVGNLEVEFGQIPDHGSEMSIEELSSSLAHLHDAKLGKFIKPLIDRMISHKMSPGFGLGAVRKHLKRNWNLGSGRQDAILLLAYEMQPKARLQSRNDSQRFLDDVVKVYAKQTGMTFDSNPKSARSETEMVDSTALKKVQEKQLHLNQKIMTLLAKNSDIDLQASQSLLLEAKTINDGLRQQLDIWNDEHGDAYKEGIQSHLKKKKIRCYDSCWNWVLQDVFDLFNKLVRDKHSRKTRDLTTTMDRISNRATARLIGFLSYLAKVAKDQKLKNSEFVTSILNELLETSRQHIRENPISRLISVTNRVCYPEHIQRANSTPSQIRRPSQTKVDLKNLPATCLCRFRSHRRRSWVHVPDFAIAFDSFDKVKIGDNEPISISIKVKQEGAWTKNPMLSENYHSALDHGIKKGYTFSKKSALVIGSGNGSIGKEIVIGLLSGGGRVIVTTSRYSEETSKFYQHLYTNYGASGSTLHLIPFNMGSRQDIESLISYVFAEDGLSIDLDYVIPFAAIPEAGRDVGNIDSQAELAHRAMLTNTIRLVGEIKNHKLAKHLRTNPTQIILPLSPNTGIFGSDGLYAESKLALQSLLQKWHSEDLGDYIAICGVNIGWTRGTGLMKANDAIVNSMEKQGVKTYSTEEMATLILAAMTPTILSLNQAEPFILDLSGGLDKVQDLKRFVGSARESIRVSDQIKSAVTSDLARERNIISGRQGSAQDESQHYVTRTANPQIGFPPLPDYKSEIAPLTQNLQGMIDLEKAVVVVGFSEVGPYGSARTRWDVESSGTLSLEGCIELAWIMGLTRHHTGDLNGSPFCGWVDSKSGETISEAEIKFRYEKTILEHCGIRILDKNSTAGKEPDMNLQEIVIQDDLDPFQASPEVARSFKAEHGDRVDTYPIDGSDDFGVRFKKNTSLFVPKPSETAQKVIAELPEGWDARRYGISEEIVSQVDPVTLYALVCTVEAFLSAGIVDPYEMYDYLGYSDVGICMGSGMGGVASLRKIFLDRMMEKPVQNDILQETFINTTAAWINMMYISSSGPIKTPVGACATAFESLDTGFDLITSGKSKVCLVGGYDNVMDEISNEFGNMKATVNYLRHIEAGRSPREMSRPTTSTRDGFVEASGAGAQIITSAKLALEMGLPIYGIVALTGTASDKISQSVPAPGKGVLSLVSETPSKFTPPLLDIKYRRRRLEQAQKQVAEWRESEVAYLSERNKTRVNGFNKYITTEEESFIEDCRRNVEIEANTKVKEALNSYGNFFYTKDDRISPLRGALAVWDLNINDIGVASMHGTSTKLGDKNEIELVQIQLSHLGREDGNPIIAVCQKSITGHPKGPAGAWMMNGALQILNTGLIPGNPNADNIDQDLEKYHHTIFLNRSIQTSKVKGIILSSFGFGQKGAQVLVLHPQQLFATLTRENFEEYSKKVRGRKKLATRRFQNAYVDNNMFVQKTEPPYRSEKHAEALLRPKQKKHAPDATLFDGYS